MRRILVALILLMGLPLSAWGQANPYPTEPALNGNEIWQLVYTNPPAPGPIYAKMSQVLSYVTSSISGLFMLPSAGNATAGALNAIAGAGGLTTNSFNLNGYGIIGPTDQPFNSGMLFKVPLNGTNYVDNVATVENDSVSSGSQCGNAAFRFRDPRIHYERAAFGYTVDGGGTCTNGFKNLAFIEASQLGPPGDIQDTSIGLQITKGSAAQTYPNTRWLSFFADGGPGATTGDVSMQDHTGAAMFYATESTGQIKLAGNRTNYILVNGANASTPVGIAANGSDAVVQLRIDGKGDSVNGGVGLAARGKYALYATNPSSLTVNYWQMQGSLTTQAVTVAPVGTDATIAARMDDKGGAGIFLASNGNPALYIHNGSASAVNYIQADGGATGLPVAFTAVGSDTDILLRLSDKGNAGVAVVSRGNYAMFASNPASAVNYTTTRGSVAGDSVVFGALGTDTNIDVKLLPKGTGLIQAGYNVTTASVAASFSATRTLAIKDGTGTTYYVPAATATW